MNAKEASKNVKNYYDNLDLSENAEFTTILNQINEESNKGKTMTIIPNISSDFKGKLRGLGFIVHEKIGQSPNGFPIITDVEIIW